MNTLNKSQQRDIAKIIVNSATLGDDYLARGLSALYRSALKTKPAKYNFRAGHNLQSRVKSRIYYRPSLINPARPHRPRVNQLNESKKCKYI
jgi:hypothetical protein